MIEKPLVPLEVAALESDKKMKVKTIRHTDCVEVGHDKFDEMVGAFLQKVGETNVVSITPMTYTHLDIGSQKLITKVGLNVGNFPSGTNFNWGFPFTTVNSGPASRCTR
jgi:hypothetical protein